jgi:ferredoxin
MKISVKIDVCSGHARCGSLAPEIYDADEIEGKCVVLNANPPSALYAQAMRGARGCPEQAITIQDDDSQTILWPPAKGK